MAALNVANIYRQYLLALIVAGLQKLAGKPKSTVLDENAYRRDVVEPTWSSLPLTLRMIGRGPLRWDEFMSAARADVFQATAGGKITIRPDAGARLDGLVQRLLTKPGQAATVVNQSSPPLPVAKPVTAPSPVPVAKPVAAAQSVPRASVPPTTVPAAATSAAQGGTPPMASGTAVGIDL